jgi:cell division protein FtsL
MVAGQGRIVVRFAIVATLFACVGLFHAATRIAVVNAGYELGKVQREQRELLGEQERLKMETATLRAASRLESIAKEQLGLARPVAGQVITLGAAGSSSPAHDPKRTVASVERAATTLNP